LLWSEELGINFPVPGVKVASHGFDAFRLLSGKIGLFTDILLQVVEVDAAVLEAFDELVVTLANGSAGKPPWFE